LSVTDLGKNPLGNTKKKLLFFEFNNIAYPYAVAPVAPIGAILYKKDPCDLCSVSVVAAAAVAPASGCPDEAVTPVDGEGAAVAPAIAISSPTDFQYPQ
jgi:hypothetical protein